MTAWHVTPTDRLPGILEHGLLLNPPQRTFRTGLAVYLTDTEQAARRWAGEVARELGGPTPMTLLRVDLDGIASTASADTDVDAVQIVVRRPVPAERIHVVDHFTANPVPNPARDGSRTRLPAVLTGELECPADSCFNTYRSPDGIAVHFSQEHYLDELDLTHPSARFAATAQ